MDGYAGSQGQYGSAEWNRDQPNRRRALLVGGCLTVSAVFAVVLALSLSQSPGGKDWGKSELMSGFWLPRLPLIPKICTSAENCWSFNNYLPPGPIGMRIVKQPSYEVVKALHAVQRTQAILAKERLMRLFSQEANPYVVTENADEIQVPPAPMENRAEPVTYTSTMMPPAMVRAYTLPSVSQRNIVYSSSSSERPFQPQQTVVYTSSPPERIPQQTSSMIQSSNPQEQEIFSPSTLPQVVQGLQQGASFSPSSLLMPASSKQQRFVVSSAPEQGVTYSTSSQSSLQPHQISFPDSQRRVTYTTSSESTQEPQQVYSTAPQQGKVTFTSDSAQQPQQYQYSFGSNYPILSFPQKQGLSRSSSQTLMTFGGDTNTEFPPSPSPQEQLPAPRETMAGEEVQEQAKMGGILQQQGQTTYSYGPAQPQGGGQEQIFVVNQGDQQVHVPGGSSVYSQPQVEGQRQTYIDDRGEQAVGEAGVDVPQGVVRDVLGDSGMIGGQQPEDSQSIQASSRTPQYGEGYTLVESSSPSQPNSDGAYTLSAPASVGRNSYVMSRDSVPSSYASTLSPAGLASLPPALQQAILQSSQAQSQGGQAQGAQGMVQNVWGKGRTHFMQAPQQQAADLVQQGDSLQDGQPQLVSDQPQVLGGRLVAQELPQYVGNGLQQGGALGNFISPGTLQDVSQSQIVQGRNQGEHQYWNGGSAREAAQGRLMEGFRAGGGEDGSAGKPLVRMTFLPAQQ